MKNEVFKLLLLFVLLAFSGNAFFNSLDTPENYIKLAAALIGFVLLLVLFATAIKRFLKHQRLDKS